MQELLKLHREIYKLADRKLVAVNISTGQKVRITVYKCTTTIANRIIEHYSSVSAKVTLTYKGDAAIIELTPKTEFFTI